MCRICGRMVRCIFDTMPSRALSRPSRIRTVTSASRYISTQPARTIRTQQKQWQPRPSSIKLPIRSAFHTTQQQCADVQPSIPVADAPVPDVPQSMLLTTKQPSATISRTTTVDAPAEIEANQKKPLVLSQSLQQLLPHLHAQKPHYITAHIHRFPYLLTEGDTLRLPFHMHGVKPGDVLRFNRATIIGSRDFTLKAGSSSPQHTSPPHIRGEIFTNKRRTGEPSYIDERLFECRMRVMGLDSGPMMVTEKKKRRIRRTRKVTSKHKYTVLKVMEVRVKSLEELMSLEGEQVVLE